MATVAPGKRPLRSPGALIDALSGLDGQRFPFLWITLIPLLTVPLTYVLFHVFVRYEEGGVSRCDPDAWFCSYASFEVGPTIAVFALPGLVNLAPFAFGLADNRKAQLSGWLAGILGVGRLALPLVLITASTTTYTDSEGTRFYEIEEGLFGERALWLMVWSGGALAWAVSLIVWGLFARLTRDLD